MLSGRPQCRHRAQLVKFHALRVGAPGEELFSGIPIGGERWSSGVRGERLMMKFSAVSIGVVSKSTPWLILSQRRRRRGGPHQRSFAPNARAPACAPNQTKKNKLKRIGDVGQPPPRRRQRIALLAERGGWLRLARARGK